MILTTTCHGVMEKSMENLLHAVCDHQAGAKFYYGRQEIPRRFLIIVDPSMHDAVDFDMPITGYQRLQRLFVGLSNLSPLPDSRHPGVRHSA